MRLHQDHGVDASADTFSLPPSLLDLITLAATPLDRPMDAIAASDALAGGPSSVGLPDHQEISGLPLSKHTDSAIALVDDNLPPMIASAFSADQLLSFKDAAPVFMAQAFAQSASKPIHTIQLSEDEPFAVLLSDLFPSDAALRSLSLTGPSWARADLVEADASIADRLIVQANLQDSTGRLLRSSDLSALTPGSEVSLSVDVSDTRLNGQGLIGLQASLNWNPRAATVLAIDLQDTLPLFRRTGDASDWADGATQLVAAALPRAGAGEALGDTAQERFAQISFRLLDPAQPLGLSFTPEIYPAVGGGTIRPDQLLNLGLDPLRLPLLKGTPEADFSGPVAVELEATFADGVQWKQPVVLEIAARNDAPVAAEATVFLPSIDEDTADPPGHGVGFLFDPVFRDVDPGDALAGIAITHLPESTARGVWQVRRGSQGWQSLTPSLAISERQALLVRRDDRLRFLPDPDWSSDQFLPSLQVRLLDQSVPLVSGTRLDLSLHQSQSAFSRDTVHLTTQVRPLNDAPEPGPVALPVLRARAGKPFAADLPDGIFVDRDLGRIPAEQLRYSLRSPDAHQPLPAWLQIDASSGRLSGVPPVATTDPLRLELIATDQAGASAIRMLELLVKPVDPQNTSPQALPVQRIELNESEQRVINLSDIFQDQDPGDALTFEAAIPLAYADWIRFDALNNLLFLQPGATAITRDGADALVLLKATDRDWAEASQQLLVSVRNTNQAPRSLQPSPPSLLRVDQGEPIALDLKAWFDDPDLPYDDQLRYLVNTADRHPVGQGSLAWLSLSGDGVLRGIPGNAQVGALDLTVTAVDRAGLTAEQGLRLVVDNVNDAPVLKDLAVPVILLGEGRAWQLDLHDWFQDPDAIHGQRLSFEITGRGALPRWLSWDPGTAMLSGTPTANDLGDVRLTLRATDGLSVRSHSLRLQIQNINDAPIVSRPLANLTVPEDERLTLDLSGVLTDPDPGDLLRYSLRVHDGFGETLQDSRLSWLQIKTSADNNFARDNRLVINPIVRSVQDGRQLTAEELSQLSNGSEFDVEIQIEDHRHNVTQPGLIGADLSLLWNPAVLAPLHTSADLLQSGLTPSLPLFPRVDASQLSRGRLDLSAASAPAFGLGSVIGDQPAERFATVRMKLIDSGFPIVLNLAINSEQEGGLGLGWQEELPQEARMVVASFSSSNRLELEIAPTNDHVREYSVELVASDPGGLSASEAFQLTIPNRNDAPSILPLTVSPLRDNSVSRIDLAAYFRDDDTIHGDRLTFSLAATGPPGWAAIVPDSSGLPSVSTAWLEVSVPGLRKPEQTRLVITATDRAGVSASQDVLLQATPRPEAPPLVRLDPSHLPSAERGEPIRLAESLKLDPDVTADPNDQSTLILRVPSQILLHAQAPSSFSTLEEQRQWQALFLQSLSSSSEQGVTRWQLDLSALSQRSSISFSEILRLLELRPQSSDLGYATAGPRGRLAMPLSLAIETAVAGDEQGLYGFDRSSFGPDWIELSVTPTSPLSSEQRRVLKDLAPLDSIQRIQLNRQLSDLVLSSSSQSQLPFHPVAQTIKSFLGESVGSDASYFHQDILLSLDWFEQPSDHDATFVVSRVDDRYYETLDLSASSRLSTALDQPVTLYQTVARDSIQNYQTSIGAITFKTAVAPARGFKVVTISLPQDQPVNSLLKSIDRDGTTTVAPFSVSQLDLSSLKRFARTAGMDADAYRDLLDSRLNTFELRDYHGGTLLGSILVGPETGLDSLRALFPTVSVDHVDGSAILVDLDGDGVSDVARMLLLDNGFWDSDPTAGIIEDPLYLSQFSSRTVSAEPTIFQPGAQLSVGRPSGSASSSSIPLEGPERKAPLIAVSRESLDALVALVRIPSPPGPQGFGSVSPAYQSVATAFSARSALPSGPLLSEGSSRGLGSPSAPPSFRGSAADLQIADAPAPSPAGQRGNEPMVPGGKASAPGAGLQAFPTLDQIWDDLRSMAEHHLMEVVALAAVVSPLLGKSGLELVKAAKPIRLRLRQSNHLESSALSTLLFLPQGTAPGPGACYQVDRFGDQVCITAVSPPASSATPGAVVVEPDHCWLWQLVQHTHQPGLLVHACRAALRAIEMAGLSRSGIDYQEWTRQLLTLHTSQSSARARPVSEQEFILQTLACLAHLGFPYHSVAR